MITGKDILTRLGDLIEKHLGPLESEVSCVSPAESAARNSIVFASTKQQLEGAINSTAPIIVTGLIAGPKIESMIDSGHGSADKLFLLTKDPYLAMALCAKHFFSHNWIPEGNSGIHPKAEVSDSASIGKGSYIGANTVIHAGVKIGQNCVVRENTVIDTRAEIGDGTVILPFVFIGRDCILGKNNVVQSFSTIGSEGFGYAPDSSNERVHIHHQSKVVLGDHVEIGASTTIDRGTFADTTIGDHCKIDNHCHFAHNVKVGKRALIAGGFLVAGSSEFGDDFTAGGHCQIGGHHKITDGVTLATVTKVMGDITEPGVYGGQPAHPIQLYRKNLVSGVRLAEMKKNISKLMREVFKERTDKKN